MKLENQLLQGSGEGITFDDNTGTGSGNLNDGDAEGDGLSKQGIDAHDVRED